jgi:hypothetical protein
MGLIGGLQTNFSPKEWEYRIGGSFGRPAGLTALCGEYSLFWLNVGLTLGPSKRRAVPLRHYSESNWSGWGKVWKYSLPDEPVKNYFTFSSCSWLLSLVRSGGTKDDVKMDYMPQQPIWSWWGPIPYPFEKKGNHSLTWTQLDCQGADREAERQRDWVLQISSLPANKLIGGSRLSATCKVQSIERTRMENSGM